MFYNTTPYLHVKRCEKNAGGENFEGHKTESADFRAACFKHKASGRRVSDRMARMWSACECCEQQQSFITTPAGRYTTSTVHTAVTRPFHAGV